MNLALGLIETKGLVGAIEAADAMVKAADVKIISKEKVTGALIIIKVMGETAAVKSAVDAGSASAQRVGQLISSHVIPRPDDQIDSILFDEKLKSGSKKSMSTRKKEMEKPVEKTNADIKTAEMVSETKKRIISKPKISKEQSKEKEVNKQQIIPKVKSSKIPSMEELVVLNVHALRRIARSTDEFPIKGREISKANRGRLLDYFKSLQ